MSLSKLLTITGSTNYEESFCNFTNPMVNIAKELWEEKLFFDLTIILNDTHFQVHRFVLYAHSPVFKKMFTTDTKDRYKDVIEFDDDLINFDAHSFSLVLQ